MKLYVYLFSVFVVVVSFAGSSVLCGQSLSIQLEWDANTEEDLAGYNIYRSNQSGSGYVRLNANLVTETAYTDTAIESGKIYYYICKAVDTFDLESGPSNEVQYSSFSEVSISEISPAIASAGTRVTVTGTGFSSGTAEVYFSGELGLDVEVVSDTELRVTVPNLPPGPVEVTVAVAGGSGTYSDFSVTDAVLSTFYFPQFADGATGTLQFQSTLILANSGSDNWVRVELYGAPDGVPMELTLGDLGTDSVFEFALKEGESVSLTTPGTGQIQVGYARIVAGEDVGGVVVFRRTDLTTGISLFEAGVPASTELKEFSLFIDSIGPRDTGFAIVYPPAEAGVSPADAPNATVTIRLYDKQYNFIAEKILDPLSPGSHLARYVHEMFDEAAVVSQAREMEGILVVTSDQPLVAVTVRQNDDPQKEFPQEVPILTTFPVIPGAPAR